MKNLCRNYAQAVRGDVIRGELMAACHDIDPVSGGDQTRRVDPKAGELLSESGSPARVCPIRQPDGFFVCV